MSIDINDVNQLALLEQISTPGPWKLAPKIGLGRYLCIGVNDETWVKSNCDAPFIVELRNAAPELIRVYQWAVEEGLLKVEQSKKKGKRQ